LRQLIIKVVNKVPFAWRNKPLRTRAPSLSWLHDHT